MRTINVREYANALDALKNANLAQSLYDDGEVIMKDALISLYGAEHHARRVAEFAVFGRGFFRHYEQIVFPPTLERTLRPYLDAGRADLVEFGYRVTMNLTADFAGIDRPAQSIEETLRLLRIVRVFGEGATLVHSTRDRDAVRREVLAALAEFERDFVAPSRERRLALVMAHESGRIDEDALPRDIMTMLLRNRERLALADDVFLREIAFYLQAGSHSTANAMTHAMHEILTWCDAHPADLDRVRTDMRFLQRCVHESLRLHPASPVAWRRAVCPADLRSHGHVGTGDNVVIDLRAANRDPDVFGADAERFNPHRDLPGNVWPFGLTFGYGPHACMGRDLDGGVVPRDESQVRKRQLGIVALLCLELLRNGAERDAADPPLPDAGTERPNWGKYPVVFRRVAASGND